MRPLLKAQLNFNLKNNRKQNEKDFTEKLDNYNEKFTYAIQSFQATIGNMSTKLNEHKEQVGSVLFRKNVALYIYKILYLTAYGT